MSLGSVLQPSGRELIFKATQGKRRGVKLHPHSLAGPVARALPQMLCSSLAASQL